MSSRPSLPCSRQAVIALCLLLLSVGAGCIAATPAKAGLYKMVLCSANVGSNAPVAVTNTGSPSNPSGIFSFENYCDRHAPYPAGNDAFLRIADNQPSGLAGHGAYGSWSWETAPWVGIAGAGGYTREPNAFNDGWRAFFWVEGYDGSKNNLLVQGSGVANGSCSGICWSTTPSFSSHLWPFGGYGNYRRFVFELQCVRQAGCDRANFNAVDANSFQLILNDHAPPTINFVGSEGIVGGEWTRGANPVTWRAADEGSGLRFERLRVDGVQRYELDHRGSCNLDSHVATGEFARYYRPCPSVSGGGWGHSTWLNTTHLSDGLHTMTVCAQDYGQSVGLSGSDEENCDQRTIRTDNTPPGAPNGLFITSANPQRYLNRFGARYSLPPNAGSPIAKVHYDVVDAAGKVVVPEKVLSATNPTEVPSVEGPPKPAELNLRVWLEDEVGLVGSPAIAPIPRDTTPPAAPQEVSVTPPATSRAAQGFDVRWRNVVDAGSPIEKIHYQLLNPAGGVAVQTHTIQGPNPEVIQDLETPQQRGKYTLKLWLEDAEGNVGVPTTAPLAYECVRSDVSGGSGISTGLGAKGEAEEIVHQGDGSTLRGRLTGAGGGVADAPVCVFSRVVTKGARDFLGLAVTGSDGDYQFAIPAGASRELSVAYRSGAREVTGRATLHTIVHPSFELKRKVVYNKGKARFLASLPGPDNNNVLVVLQVKRGKGWLAFRRYRTRDNGQVDVGYRFNKTNVATKYVMRLQVRTQSGYPYLQGNSDRETLIVLPKAARQRGDARRSTHARHERRPGWASDHRVQRGRDPASPGGRSRSPVASRR